MRPVRPRARKNPRPVSISLVDPSADVEHAPPADKRSTPAKDKDKGKANVPRHDSTDTTSKNTTSSPASSAAAAAPDSARGSSLGSATCIGSAPGSAADYATRAAGLVSGSRTGSDAGTPTKSLSSFFPSTTADAAATQTLNTTADPPLPLLPRTNPAIPCKCGDNLCSRRWCYCILGGRHCTRTCECSHEICLDPNAKKN